MNYHGDIKWDKTKPNGQPRRCVSNNRARELLEFKLREDKDFDKDILLCVKGRKNDNEFILLIYINCV